MKRFLLPLLAVLTLGYIGLAPQKAEAATCTAVANNGFYPQGFLTWCAASTSTQQDAITGLYTLSTNFADAKTKLTATPKTHEFFVFDTVADLTSVCTTNGNTTSNPPVPACPNQGPVPTGVYGVTWRTGTCSGVTS